MMNDPQIDGGSADASQGRAGLRPSEHLSDALAQQITAFIFERGLSQGDRLPNEIELATLLGAGRSSVREAMKLLASRNIVTIKQGSGTYVSKTPGLVDDPLGFSFIADKIKLSFDLLEVRLLLEPAICSLAATRASETDIENIGMLADDVERLIRAGENHASSDIEFHRAIAASTGNIVVDRLVPIITFAIPLFIDLTESDLPYETIQTHRAIAQAIAHHDGAAAHDAMYLHLVYNRSEIRRRTEASPVTFPDHRCCDR